MNHAEESSQSSARSVSKSASDTILRGGLLVLARSVWVVIGALTVGLFIAALPMLSRQLQTVCVRATACPEGQLNPTGLQTIHELGFSVGGYAVYVLALYIATSLVWFVVGAVIFWRRSDDWMALLVALFLVTFNIFPGVGKSIPAFVYPVWDSPLKFLSYLAVIPLGLFFYLFPDGKFVPRWTCWLAVVLFVVAVPRFFFPNTPFDFATWPGGLNVLTVLCILGAMLFAQVYRYRRVSDAVQRQQTRWVVFGVMTALVVIMAAELYYLLFPTLSQPGSQYSFFFGTVIPLVLLAIPLSIGIAILRYRLWDIDVIINRTLVYGALTASVIGLYILVVVGLGSLLQAQGNILLSLLATGLIAILFQPLRRRVQQAVNRLLYGERDDPYAVLARLSSRLEATLVPETVLPTIVETVAQTLKLPYVAIALIPEQHPLPATVTRTVGAIAEAGAEMPDIAASYGSPTPDPVRVPLVYQAETVGYLLLAARAGEKLGKTDARLLADLARQAGVAVYAVRLTASLQHLSTSLQQARERLVTSREEERRRLRRDLHDDLGPTLASLTFKVDAARNLLTQDSVRADMLLAEVRQHAQNAITDIRRLVYNLRPPALDEFGLLSALREQAVPYQHQGLEVVVDTPSTLPLLPAAVEVAVYRIVQEALTNVSRHAGAQHCLIRLALDAETVQLDISDDGKGIPTSHHIGVGLHTMHERASELGGSCAVTASSSGGTTVRVTFPFGATRDSAIPSAQDAAQQDQASVHVDDMSVAKPGI